MAIDISVAICTYNRAQQLQCCLESLASQIIKIPFSWELLVVDNNSSDSTKAVVEGFSEKLPIRYVFESEQGLSFARNRAITEAKGELLIFTDDDVVFSESWLESYFKGAQKFSEASYFGGKVLPDWQEKKPAWWPEPTPPLLKGLLVHYDLGDSIRQYEISDPTPFGASFALRRQLRALQTKFREDLGVKGDIPARGEEAEYLERAVQSGFSGAYLGNAIAFHPVDASRLTARYLYQYGVEKGRELIILGSDARAMKFGQTKYLIKGVFQLLKGHRHRLLQCIINMGIQRGIRKEARSLNSPAGLKSKDARG